MKSFIYHLQDKDGNLIDYVTSAKKATELVEGHEVRLAWFEKKGFIPVKGKKPRLTFDPNKTIPCPICKQPMTPKQGVSKAGKPWKGYFCSNRDHPPVWAV